MDFYFLKLCVLWVGDAGGGGVGNLRIAKDSRQCLSCGPKPAQAIGGARYRRKPRPP